MNFYGKWPSVPLLLTTCSAELEHVKKKVEALNLEIFTILIAKNLSMLYDYGWSVSTSRLCYNVIIIVQLLTIKFNAVCCPRPWVLLLNVGFFTCIFIYIELCNCPSMEVCYCTCKLIPFAQCQNSTVLLLDGVYIMICFNWYCTHQLYWHWNTT